MKVRINLNPAIVKDEEFSLENMLYKGVSLGQAYGIFFVEVDARYLNSIQATYPSDFIMDFTAHETIDCRRECGRYTLGHAEAIITETGKSANTRYRVQLRSKDHYDLLALYKAIVEGGDIRPDKKQEFPQTSVQMAEHIQTLKKELADAKSQLETAEYVSRQIDDARNILARRIEDLTDENKGLRQELDTAVNEIIGLRARNAKTEEQPKQTREKLHSPWWKKVLYFFGRE